MFARVVRVLQGVRGPGAQRAPQRRVPRLGDGPSVRRLRAGQPRKPIRWLISSAPLSSTGDIACMRSSVSR
ncbi:hypothetical protein F8R89_05090 [Streptomyces sp. SS1-1]|nr:hypothetical protein F8R89_05090 [Streptomyces sp. SS1-1]